MEKISRGLQKLEEMFDEVMKVMDEDHVDKIEWTFTRESASRFHNLVGRVKDGCVDYLIGGG